MRDAINRTDTHKQEMIVRNLVQRGVVDRSDASKKMQTLDISLLNGSKPTKVEHWERYGITYRPLEGAEVLAIALGGNPDHLVVTDVADRRHRPTNLNPGELMIHDHQGQSILIGKDYIKIATGKKLVIESDVEITGDITHTGNYNQSGVHIDSNGPHTA
ncbi:MAG: phage baseplate assembly protein V [Hyphomicrobium sp.]|uniref:phage baseplate assembly protein V n=1 Tax=Hyphomicrobium sp. TaxID=82 RepID=UPI003D0DBCF6